MLVFVYCNELSDPKDIEVCDDCFNSVHIVLISMHLRDVPISNSYALGDGEAASGTYTAIDCQLRR